MDNPKVNAILRRINQDEDAKIEFPEFGEYITPVMQGFNKLGCKDPPVDLKIPKQDETDDVLP